MIDLPQLKDARRPHPEQLVYETIKIMMDYNEQWLPVYELDDNLWIQRGKIPASDQFGAGCL